MLRNSSWDSLRENPAENAVRCRIGTKRMLELLEKITDGKGEMEDLDKLEETAKFIQARSLCGLGKSAPLPVHQYAQELP